MGPAAAADRPGGAGAGRAAGRALPPDRPVWVTTAIEAPVCAGLAGREEADVAVVGGGVAGLSAALHLAEAGRSVVLLEAAEPAAGASGRAAGQIIPGLHDDPEGLVRRLGEARGERLAAWAAEAAALVFALIERHGIDCQPMRNGWIEAAYTRRELATIQRTCGQWAARGADVAQLDRGEVAALLGTPLYLGGWIDRRGGSVQPLNYALGLAHAAIRQGARLYARSPAQRLERREGRWTVATAAGAVSAVHVIVATNGYSDALVPGLRRSVVALLASQAASSPLDPATLATILPDRQAAADHRRMLVSFRISPDDRLVVGGPGGTGETKGAALFRNVARTSRELFGHLRRFDWQFGWSGMIALTTDKLPHLHEPEPGLHVALGCNGRGIALATALGRLLAERACGRPAADLELPVTPLRPIPLHAALPPVIAVGQRARALLDQMDRRFR